MYLDQIRYKVKVQFSSVQLIMATFAPAAAWVALALMHMIMIMIMPVELQQWLIVILISFEFATLARSSASTCAIILIRSNPEVGLQRCPRAYACGSDTDRIWKQII